MAVLGREAASQAMTSADIVDGAFTLNDLNFTDVPANLDITGTIDKNTMRLAEGVTVIGDVTISDDLVLAKLSDDGVGITMTTDATTRTITGSGSIESTTIAQTHSPTLTGMTGTLGSGVTFPDGHILQAVSSGAIATTTAASGTSWTPTGVTVSITPSNSAHDILVMADIGSYIYNSAGASSTLYVGLSADAGTSFLTQKQMRIHDYGGSGQLHVMSVPFHFLHSPSTTSSVTYSIYFKKVTGEAASVNEDDSDSVIIAFEISDS